MKSEESVMKQNAIKVIFGLILCLLSFSIYLMFADLKIYRANIPVSLDNITFTSLKACNFGPELIDYEQLINQAYSGNNISQLYYRVFEHEAKQFIETYKELQDYEIKQSGDVNQFTKIEQDLEVCQTKINNTKFMNQQILKDQAESIQNYTQQKNDLQIKLQDDQQKMQNKSDLYSNLIIKLTGLQQDFQRKQVYYQEEKNKTITADTRKQREEEIANKIRSYKKIIKEEESEIASNSLSLESTMKSIEENEKKIEKLQFRYNYAKDLQNAFNSYIKNPSEDFQVIYYIQQASQMLKQRVENQKILLKEKNQTQLEINKKVYQVTTALQEQYEETIAVVTECSGERKCIFDKPTTDLTMSEMNKEVKGMGIQMHAVTAQLQSYRQLSIQLQEQIEWSKNKLMEAQEKLAQQIEEQRQLANMGKEESLQDQLNQIEKLKNQIMELDKKIKEVKGEIDNLNNVIQPQEQELNSIDLSINDTSQNYNNRLQQNEIELRKQVKECLIKKKTYEKYHINQDNVSKQIEMKRKLLKQQIQNLQKTLTDMKRADVNGQIEQLENEQKREL